MPSSVFFKFKSQKEPTRVEFDGTGISVFELKRDIIIKSGLGDGTDFDLAIYSEDGKEEYDDDTTIIPRATVVTARRLPAIKQGAGKAARYVTGKMPGHAKNSFKKDQVAKDKAEKASASIQQAGTEEEKMQAMFQVLSGAWSAEREDLSHEKPVFFNKPGAHRPANVPDHDPPNGYICYRCGEKGHWIQMCPTNDDPEYDNRRRVKRTTGIPRSFLTTVDKNVALSQSGGDEEAKRPPGIMVNADGDFVIARPDKASWEKYQAKAKSSAAASKGEAAEEKELRERGLECPADKRMFIEPMKTPCCGKTYCNDCITNALIESDFVCPACKADGVLIDDLKPDDEVTEKIKEYLQEKEKEKEEEAKEASKSPNPAPKSPADAPATPAKAPSPSPSTLATDKGEEDPTGKAAQSPKDGSGSPDSKQVASSQGTEQPSQAETATTSGNTQNTSATDLTSATEGTGPQQPNPKKRPADDLLENPKIPKAPKAMQQKMQQEEQAAMQQQFMNGPGMMGMPNMPNMMPFGGMNPMGMGMPNMGMPMGMPMMNPMMNGPGGFPPMNGNPMFNGMMPMMNGGMNGGMNGNMNPNMGGGGGAMGRGMNGGGMNNNFQQRNQNFNQGYNQFNQPSAADDEAYFRKPVNPHRHQNRQKRVRPSDYREL